MNKIYMMLLLLLGVLIPSSTYAIPTWDGGLIVQPQFWQDENPWGPKRYANMESATATFENKGCAITSLAMLLRFHGLHWMPDALHSPTSIKTDPEFLNEWMLQNDGYSVGDTEKDRGNVQWEKIEGFYYHSAWWYNWNNYISPNHSCQPVSNKETCFKPTWSTDTGRLLDNDLFMGMPDVAKIWYARKKTDGTIYESPYHVVLIAGYSQQDKSYIAYDPGRSYSRIPPRGLSNEIFYPPVAKYNPAHGIKQIYRYSAIYSKRPPDLSSLSSWIYSPVEIQFIDPKGRITGYDSATGTKVEDIPRANYSEEAISSLNPDDPPTEPVKNLTIDGPPSGNYILKIFGTGDGPYTIAIKGTKEDGTVNLDTSITGTATIGLQETYRVTYSPTGEASLSQTNNLPVANAGSDQTGEQGYEITLDGSASSDSDGDPIKYSWSFISKPTGSTAALSDANAVNPTFTPDLAGTYVLQLILNDYFTDSTPATVTITATPIKSRISVTPNLSTPLSAGSNSISFDVNNTGRIGISNGIIDMSLKDPDGATVYSGTQTFSIAVGETKTVNVAINIPSLKFGNYTLTYTQSDETRTGEPTTVSIPNSAVTEYSFDKISYKVRETANLTLNLTNTGKFNLNAVSVTVSVTDAGYMDTRTVSISPSPQPSPQGGEGVLLAYAIPIPDTVSTGQHDVNITLTLPSGSSTVQTAKLTVPESVLSIGYSGPTTLTAGDVISLTIENTGGVDTTYTTEKVTITDNRGVEVQLGVMTGAIMVGERKSIADVLVPGQMTAGLSSLSIALKDTKIGKLTTLVTPLFITGLEASLAARTDKDVYLNTEMITGLTTLTNSAFGIENGVMDVKVVKYKEATAGEFTHFLPKTGWGPIKNPGYIATAPDGSVYVLDYSVKGCGFMCSIYDYYILKFSSSGAFITTWGGFGSSDGQFYEPQALAVGPDGSVYVADGGNNRIQKFDSNGNFIAKWGSQGYADGQFDYPMSMAVGPDGSVYVGDYWGERIQRFDSNGNFIAKWGSYGSGDGQFNRLRGIAVSLDGSVYVADSGNFRIQKFDSNGNFITKWGSYGSGDGQFDNFPTNIALSPDGSVYIISVYSSRVQKFDSNGNFIMGRWESFYPKGIAIAPDSNIYITGSSQIMKFDTNWQLISTWGNYGSSDGQFNAPYDVAIGSDDTIYVVDTYNHRIQRFDRNGNFIGKWGSSGSGNGQFYYPYGIATTQDGFVYVVEASGSRVQKFDSSGNFITRWGSYGSGDGQFYYPRGIAIAPDGSVYVADTYNKRIQKFDSNGNFITKWGSYGSGDGQFSYPYSISVAANGSVYVADTNNNRIQKFDTNGNFISKWGTYGSGDGQFSYPYDMAVGLDGSVYVADTGNYRIQKFDSSGNFVAKWNVVDKDGQAYQPYGIAVGADGSIYAVNTANNRVLRMVPSNGIEIFFETTLPIIQSANTSQDYTTNIGMLNTAGKLYLEAILKNSLGQTISAAEYPFYIVEGDTVLLFNTDKKVYRQGETVTITGEVKNLAAVSLDNAIFELKSGTTSLINQAVTVPAGGSYPFTFITSADAEGTIRLTGTVTQNNSTLAEITDQYEVAAPSVIITATAPNVVGRNSFDLIVEVKNTGKVEASMQYTVSTMQGTIDSQSLIISAGETKALQYSQQITAATTYTVTLSGDVSVSATKTVVFGEAAEIQLGVGGSELGVRQEGRIEIPVTITNTGLVDESLTIDFTLQPIALTESRNYFLPKGGSISDTLYYNLSQGDYQVSAVSALPNASTQAALKVIRENDVAMTTSVSGQDANGLIPVTMNLVNNGYNTLNGNIALAVVNNEGKAIWRGEVLVSGLASQASQNYIINIGSAGITSGAYPTKSILYSTSGQQLASNQTQVRISGPIFEITAMPNYPTFTVGKQGSFTFAIKNTGTVTGTTSFSVKAMDVLNQSVTDTFNPGEEKTFSFSFTVPEDAEEKDYLADYDLMPLSSQGMSGEVKFHIAGVNIGGTASLDKEAYRNGDTAVLTLNISKLSQFEDGDYLAIIRYGAYHDMKQFTLDSQPVSLTFSVPLSDITGENLFYSIHFTSGRTIYRSAISINKTQPDLFIQDISAGQGSLTTYTFSVFVANQGEMASEATTMNLYDGDPLTGASLIATMTLPGLNQNESTTVVYDWNVLGKAGSHTVYAVVDPNNTVTEWIETNNTDFTDTTIPNVAISVSTSEQSYKANHDVGVLNNMTNLTANITYQGIILDTTIINTQGNSVFSAVSDAPTLSPATETSYALNWNTQSNAPGDYTATAKLLEAANILAEGSAIFTILPTPSLIGSMSLGKDTVIQGFSLEISYTLKNNGNVDLSGGEVKAKFIHAGGGNSIEDYTNALPSLNILKETTGTIAIDKLDIEPGDYTVKLTAIVEGANFVIGETALKVLPPIEVTKGISMLPRVLVLSDETNDAQQNPAEAVIKDVLDSLGVYYKIARDMTEFKEEMRSGIYNAYLLTGKQPLIDGLDKELRERINTGETLILINYEMMEDTKFREFTGVKNIGSLPAMERGVTLYESPISSAGTMTVNGKIQKFEIASNSAVTAGMVFEQNEAYSVIVLNTYGKGKVITFAIDAGESAKYTGSTTYSLLLNNAVNYSAPGEVIMLPSYPAAIEIGLTSLGADFDLKVKEKFSTNGVLLTYPGAVTGEDSIAWEFKLNADSGKKLLYLTKIDSLGGTYTNTTTVEYLKNNAYELYNTYPIEITTQSLTDLEMNILNKLDGINGAGAISEKYRNIINAPLVTKQDIQKAIQDLIAVIDSLNTLGGDANVIRLDMGNLIRVFERRWMEASEAA